LAGETFTFNLSADERKALRKAMYQKSVLLPALNWAMVAIWAAIFVLQATDLVHSLFRIPMLIISAFMVVLYLCSGRIAAARARRFAAEGSLQVHDGGLTGTLDGKPMSLPWKSIASATDIDDAIVLMPRPSRVPAIAIPKHGIEDAPGFWSLLEDRLVAKRGLVAPTAPRKHILTTVR
jgi:hypothetical protein